jgi:flagellar hook-associated protein 1 FlgK
VFAKGDSSNAVALGELGNAVTQRDTRQDAFGSAAVLGVDVSKAPSGTTYALSGISFDRASSTASLNTGSGVVTGTVTSSVDAADPSQQIVTLDTGAFRITLQASSSASIDTVLGTLNGATFGTASAASTIGDQYGQSVAALGVASSTAVSQSNNQQVLVTQLTREQQQTSGVSLDEETTHLIQYQHAYQAAARVISVVDQMLDTLINNTGVVGR